MNPFDCEFVMIGGLWLPVVAGIERTPVYIGDYERAVSGVLRTAHVGKAMEWRVLLQGVAGEDVEALEEVLRSPVPVGCNIMGTEVIASVTELSSAHNPKRHGPDADWGRMNYEILVREVVVENIMPGFTYEYQAFFDTGSFVWDWNAAGQPDEVDVLLVAGGGGGGAVAELAQFGAGGGGGGGVQLVTGISVSGNVSGSVGAGGPPEENGQNSTFGAHTAIGGGHGGGITIAAAGGSGGGGKHPDPAGTGSQGHNGGAGNGQTGPGDDLQSTQYGGGGGGGGAGGPGHPGVAPNRARGAGGPGGQGADLLALGWNYRLTPPAPRYVAGGGGGGVGGWDVSTTTSRPAPAPGGIGGGGRGGGPNAASKDGEDGRVNTGGGGGASSWSSGSGTPGAGGSGLVIVRWLVNS